MAEYVYTGTRVDAHRRSCREKRFKRSDGTFAAIGETVRFANGVPEGFRDVFEAEPVDGRSTRRPRTLPREAAEEFPDAGIRWVTLSDEAIVAKLAELRAERDEAAVT